MQCVPGGVVPDFNLKEIWCTRKRDIYFWIYRGVTEVRVHVSRHSHFWKVCVESTSALKGHCYSTPFFEGSGYSQQYQA